MRPPMRSWGALAAALLLGACGFAPAYAPGGPGEALRGRVAVDAADTPDGFALRARLEDRLGVARAPAATLAVAVEVARAPASIAEDGSITRYDLDGTATWRLATATAGAAAASGSVDAFTGFSTTGSTVATRAAEEDARERLMTLLADAVVARLLLLPPDALPPDALSPDALPAPAPPPDAQPDAQPGAQPGARP